MSQSKPDALDAAYERCKRIADLTSWACRKLSICLAEPTTTEEDWRRLVERLEELYRARGDADRLVRAVRPALVAAIEGPCRIGKLHNTSWHEVVLDAHRLLFGVLLCSAVAGRLELSISKPLPELPRLWTDTYRWAIATALAMEASLQEMISCWLGADFLRDAEILPAQVEKEYRRAKAVAHVQVELSAKTATDTAPSRPKEDAEDTSPSLHPDHLLILNALAGSPTRLRLDALAYITARNRGTVGMRVNELITMGLAERPYGKKGGIVIKAAGKAVAAAASR